MAMTEVRLLEPEEGEKTLITGFEALFRTTPNVTGDLLDYFVLTVPAGGGAPLHIHHKNDETLHVVRGDFTFQVNDDVSDAPQGTFLYIPRGVPHKFTNAGDSTGVLVGTFTPAGTFEFFDALTKIPQDDMDEIAAVSRQYGHEVVEAGSY